jgi:glycosyltransferase involved in cell wall biosynthesis
MWTGESFAVWVAGLRDFAERLVRVGREEPATGPDHYRLRDDVELVALPDYSSLARVPTAALAMVRSLKRLWRLLDGVDVVWLLGPHPLALAFAAMTLVRGRRAVLGVRQDMPSHIRSRHPRRLDLWMAAVALEGTWRLLARACPVVVVGADLATRYSRSRAVLAVSVSLMDERDIVSLPSALARSYDGALRAISVGRLDPEKNPLLLADTLAALRRRDPRWTLLVCGSGSLEDALRERLRTLGVAGAADVRGYVPLDHLRSLYRESHVMLHVSWTEGVPQVLFEAFASGLPVVATDVGGVADATDGAGLLVPPGQTEPLVDAASRIADDADLRERLIEAGLVRAQAHTATSGLSRLAEFLGGSADC